jgi:hypothetical protein
MKASPSNAPVAQNMCTIQHCTTTMMVICILLLVTVGCAVRVLCKEQVVNNRGPSKIEQAVTFSKQVQESASYTITDTVSCRTAAKLHHCLCDIGPLCRA